MLESKTIHLENKTTTNDFGTTLDWPSRTAMGRTHMFCRLKSMHTGSGLELSDVCIAASYILFLLS